MEDRISELEARVAFQEEMIDKLNDVVANQDKQLMNLVSLVEILNQKIINTQEGHNAIHQDDTPPPHY